MLEKEVYEVVSMVHIVTDSTADLPKKVADAYRISVMPLNLHFGEEILKDGEDIWAEEFYHRLSFEATLPTTSQPSPGEFVDLYRRIAKKGDTVVSIHLSEKLSGTINSSRLAGEMLKGEIEVIAIDSFFVTMPLSLVVLEAAKAAQEGRELEEILSRIEWTQRNMAFYFTVGSLEHLHRTGRIGKATTLLGNLLSIRPVLSIKDGLIVPVEKFRGNSNRLDRRFLDLIRADLGEDPAEVFIIHANAPDEEKRLEETCRERIPGVKVVSAIAGPIVGVHAGPGAFGLAALPTR